MNEHPLRDRLQQLLGVPENLSPEQARQLTEHLEGCAVCLETVEELLRDPVVERCREMLQRVEEFLHGVPTMGPIPPLPKHDREEAAIRFPGRTPEAPLGLLGAYAIQREIGRGGFGAVFRAFDQRLRRTVAIKILLPERAPHAVYRSRFENEARAIASIQHFDHVVQVFEVVSEVTEEFRSPYMVMEWIDGDTLKDHLEKAGGRLPWQEAVPIAQQIAHGLAEIHQHLTAHRDLKPGNVMFARETGRAKIMDFGLALPNDPSEDSRLTQVGVILGTPRYMSPEQARRDPVLDGRSDVFSLGVLLYEMLTGRMPFDGKNQLELLKAIAAPETDPAPVRKLNRNVPRDLETIVHTCLAKNPAERYQTAQALAEDFHRFVEGKPIAARPASWYDQLAKWARRHPAVAGLLAVMFLGLVAIAAAGWEVSRREAGLRSQVEQERDQTKTERDRARVLEKREAGLRIEAELERDRTRKERDRARALEHSERAERARVLARRGLWPEARKAFDQAIADNAGDADSLRVERLRCLFTYEERPNLLPELNTLATLKNLSPANSAIVLLHRADYLFADWDKQKEAANLLAQSLVAPDGLTGADRFYAEGLAAPTAQGAIEKFRSALEIDPFHHRANSALLTTFLFLGRFDEARARSDFMRQTFRDDPLPIFADAWTALLRGDREACYVHLQPLGNMVGEKRATDLKTYFGAVGDLLDIGEKVSFEDPAALAIPAFQAGLRVANLASVSKRALEPFGFGVPTVSRLTGSLEGARLALLDLIWDNPDAAFAKLEAANRIHPDAMLLHMQATAQLTRSLQREKKKDHPAAVRLAMEARDLFYQAADAPTILPRASWRYEARLAGLMLDHALASEPLAKDPARLSRMRTHGDLAAEQGRRFPKARQHSLPKVVENKNLFDLDLARFLVAEWLRDEPNAPKAIRLRARLDTRAGDWSSALRYADRALAAQPDDREIQSIRTEALSGLKKQLD